MGLFCRGWGSGKQQEKNENRFVVNLLFFSYFVVLRVVFIGSQWGTTFRSSPTAATKSHSRRQSSCGQNLRRAKRGAFLMKQERKTSEPKELSGLVH
tara:strand:- start:320 stop:610 length:291 start_codon:yes stop_codon:yes gene_type:complete